MSDGAKYGLSRQELERELRWMLRKAPRDPAKLTEFLGQVLVTLIDKNNAALAQAAREQDGADPVEDY